MLSDSDKLLLRSGSEELGVALDSVATDRFELFASRLQEANKYLNLTRIPPEDTVLLHFLDSLILSRAVPVIDNATLVDIGTGAGFPGLPLAIAYSTLKVTLVDSTQKRLTFLDGLISELAIKNVRLVHGRAEDLANSEMHRAYDIVAARAVAKTDRLAGWMIPFIAHTGFAVAYKSESAWAEIEDSKSSIKSLGGTLERIVKVVLPFTNIVRLLAVITASSGQRTQQSNKNHHTAQISTTNNRGRIV